MYKIYIQLSAPYYSSQMVQLGKRERYYAVCIVYNGSTRFSHSDLGQSSAD